MRIITHACPHFDELVAVWLLKTFGSKKFPGIKKAKIEIYDPRETYTDQDILIGVGGGIFDEHATINSKGKSQECAATLVAKSLEIDTKPELKQILNYVRKTDLNPASSPFEIASFFNLVSRRCPNKPEKAYRIASEFIEAKYEEQKEFFKAIDEFKIKAFIQEIETVGYCSVYLAVIKTGNEQILKAARYANKNNTKKSDILIVFRTDGHVQIFNTKHTNFDLFLIVKELRKSELQKKELPIPAESELLKIGVIEGTEEWYFPNKEMILNGSHSHPEVSPTTLSVKEVILAVIKGIKSSC